MNLLIVDDEPIVLQGLLNGIDWNRLQFRDVLSASSFEEALDVLKQNSVDILLTDIELSEKNGLDLVEWVKENHPGVRCVILSCHDEFPYAQRAVRLECVDYVLKPIPYAQLTEILAKAKEKVLSERGRTELEDYGKAYFTYLKRNDSKPEERCGRSRNKIHQSAYLGRALRRRVGWLCRSEPTPSVQTFPKKAWAERAGIYYKRAHDCSIQALG